MGAGLVLVTRVLVLVEEERDARVAHVLATEPSLTRLAVMGEAKSNSLERVEDPAGFDVVVSRTASAIDVAARIGAAAVTGAEVESAVPTVVGASLMGWARALAVRMSDAGARVNRVSIAHPGGPGTGNSLVEFPAPVGRLRGTVLQDLPYQIVVAQTESTWGTALVETSHGDQALVDDFNFLAPICLAAGVSLVPDAGLVRVWERPNEYLAKTEELGLVAGARVAG